MAAKAVSGGVTPSLTAADLVAAMPELKPIAEIETFQISNVASPEITLQHLVAVRDKINKLEADGFDGVVVTQGTDTIEETSWALDLMCSTRIGIVVTGAMRNPTQAGADGPANLLASVLVAGHPIAKDLGVLVVFNDEFQAARFVQKSHTSNVGAFTSPSCGPIGWMAEGVPIIPFQTSRTKTVKIPKNFETPWLPIIKPSLGDDGALLNAACSAGAKGIVLEAAGGGHVSEMVAERAVAAAKEIPVILSSRTRGGSVLTQTYGFVGSETDLLSRGLISSGYLDALKARILLLLSIVRGDGRKALEEEFARPDTV